MSFPARFPGQCVSCEGRIHEGDPIVMTDSGARHDECDALATADPETSQPACPACWLVHPEGKCDR